MGNVNACVLKTILLFILSPYLMDRLWVSNVSCFIHPMVVISALPLVLSQWAFLLHRTVYFTPPPLVNKYVFTYVAIWFFSVVYGKKKFFIPFALRVGARNVHSNLRDCCRFLFERSDCMDE